MPMPALANAPWTMSGFSGAPDTLRAMIAAAQGARGERSMRVRFLVEDIIRRLHPKAYAAEVVVVRDWVATNVRYTNDPAHVELVKDPERLVEEYEEYQDAVGDCDDMACLIGTMCLQLGREVQFVAAGFREPGLYTHVFCRVKDPKSGQWINCDPVAGTKERQMLESIVSYELWSLDEPPGHGPVGRG